MKKRSAMSLIGPSRHFAAAQQLGRFWREADIKWQVEPARCVENDPDSDIGRAANAAPAPPSGMLVLANTMLSNVADMRRREFSCAAWRRRGRKRSKGE